MRSRGGEGSLYTVIFGYSSGELPSGGGSASETVIIDCVDVFVYLLTEGLDWRSVIGGVAGPPL